MHHNHFLRKVYSTSSRLFSVFRLGVCIYFRKFPTHKYPDLLWFRFACFYPICDNSFFALKKLELLFAGWETDSQSRDHCFHGPLHQRTGNNRHQGFSMVAEEWSWHVCLLFLRPPPWSRTTAHNFFISSFLSRNSFAFVPPFSYPMHFYAPNQFYRFIRLLESIMSHDGWSTHFTAAIDRCPFGFEDSVSQITRLWSGLVSHLPIRNFAEASVVWHIRHQDASAQSEYQPPCSW